MFDLKDTSVFKYKVAIHRYFFFLGWFGEVIVMKIVSENFVQ